MKLFRYLLLLSIVFAAAGQEASAGDATPDPCLAEDYAEANCALPPLATPSPCNASPMQAASARARAPCAEAPHRSL